MELGFVTAALVIRALAKEQRKEGSLPSDSCTFRIHERWQQSFVAAKRSHQKVDAVCCSNASVSLVCLLVHVMELNMGL